MISYAKFDSCCVLVLDWSSVVEHVWHNCLVNPPTLCAAGNIKCSGRTHLLKDTSVHCPNVSEPCCGLTEAYITLHG